MREYGSDRLDAHGTTIARTFDGEDNLAINQSEQSVILANSDIRSGVKLRTALANDDGASRDGFATKCLDAEHFRL